MSQNFIYLASATLNKPPIISETGKLMRDGLGKKQLRLFECDGPSELHGEKMFVFPMLKEGGGYEQLRISGSGDS